MRRRRVPPTTSNKSETKTKHRNRSTNSVHIYTIICLVSTILIAINMLVLFWRTKSTKEQERRKLDDQNEEEEEDHFLIPPDMEPGKMTPIIWRSDEKKADDDGRIIALPPQLTDRIREYCDRVGLTDLFWSLPYSKSSRKEDHIVEMKDGLKWTVVKPIGEGEHWLESDITWIDVADENTYEEVIKLIARGGFEKILDVLGEEFDADNWVIGGLAFTVMSHSSRGQMHGDAPGLGNDIFNLYFPLILPEDGKAQLNIGDYDDRSRVKPIDFQYNVGVAMGGDTRHGTTDCDYRKSRGIRASISIYIADVTEDNVDRLSHELASLFPVPGDTEWLLAQRGRFWGGDKDSSLLNDKGRDPYPFEDDEESDCSEVVKSGKCETDLYNARMECPRSCGVYVDDMEYFSKFT